MRGSSPWLLNLISFSELREVFLEIKCDWHLFSLYGISFSSFRNKINSFWRVLKYWSHLRSTALRIVLNRLMTLSSGLCLLQLEWVLILDFKSIEIIWVRSQVIKISIIIFFIDAIILKFRYGFDIILNSAQLILEIKSTRLLLYDLLLGLVSRCRDHVLTSFNEFRLL